MAPVADDAERAEDYQPYIPSAPSSNPYGSYDYGLSNILSYPSYDNTGYGYNTGSSGSYDPYQNFGEVSSYGYVSGQRAAAPDAYAMWKADYGRHWDGKVHTNHSDQAVDIGHVHNNMENYMGGIQDKGVLSDFDQDDHARYQGSWISATHNNEAGDATYDKSWELGLHPSDARAFSDINDEARLQCKVCKIDFQVMWDTDNDKFVLKQKNGSDFYTDEAAAITACDADQDGDGDAPTTFCPYSSGVCFVEERRQFGFLVSFERGCKQAKACYMQKYQNFLVKAGRQCWPVDATNTAEKIARRPYDIKADEWYYNANGNHADSHDKTFTDFTDGSPDSGGLVSGLYVDPDYVLDGSSNLNYNSLHIIHGHSGAYKNGMKETSRCTQCCSNADNCNASWRPQTETDWAADYSSTAPGRK
ncbi:Oidioi.mRNA.OKI2018_I69.chr1.g665.t1.cds [Oikopleura dioica]|uniref:Oidioi.mRNA.OKI2018_I69.chr1.g665.t1.cds n=1 Tax=Oikopleura dioica TaxID=34765 RepID=A0ABN7SKJ9_OIKDI|nr:Oidioi.mRNA.OKI2018_I69.chr1.g665.t1.cds [Oikopleura dioica]